MTNTNDEDQNDDDNDVDSLVVAILALQPVCNKIVVIRKIDGIDYFCKFYPLSIFCCTI